MDLKSNSLDSSTKASKDLLYSEYTGTTVIEHVLGSLEKKNNLNKSEEIKQFFRSEKNSGPLDRAKRLITLINGNEETNPNQPVSDNIGDIDVVVEIGESPSGTDASAWFILNQSNNEVFESTDSEHNQNSARNTENSFLEFDSDSTDPSDDESEQSLPSVTEKKLPKIIMDDSSETSQDESEPCLDSTGPSDDKIAKTAPSFSEKSFSSIVMDNFSDSSPEKSESCISISPKRKIIEIESDLSDCSDFESASREKICDSTVNEESNFVNSSNCGVFANSNHDHNCSVLSENVIVAEQSEIFSSNSLHGYTLAGCSQNVSVHAEEECVNSVESTRVSSSDSLTCHMLPDSSQNVFVSDDKDNVFSVKSPKISSSDSLNYHALADSSQNVSAFAAKENVIVTESSKMSSSNSLHKDVSICAEKENAVSVELLETPSNENLQFCPILLQRKRKLSFINTDSLDTIDNKDCCENAHFSKQKNLCCG